MSKLNLLHLIVPREAEQDYIEFLHNENVYSLFSFLCHGTAGPGLLNEMGLENMDKVVILAAVPDVDGKRLMKRCVSYMGLNVAGRGIAFVIPMDAAGGQSSLRALIGDQTLSEEEVSDMQEKSPNVLVVAISENGTSDMVMQAARKGGAGGGTVVHAKGTAGEMAKRFLGVSLASEKEMTLILVARESRNAVMRAIMDEAGIQTEAHTVLFSMPVEHVAGIKNLVTVDDE